MTRGVEVVGAAGVALEGDLSICPVNPERESVLFKGKFVPNICVGSVEPILCPPVASVLEYTH